MQEKECFKGILYVLYYDVLRDFFSLVFYLISAYNTLWEDIT